MCIALHGCKGTNKNPNRQAIRRLFLKGFNNYAIFRPSPSKSKHSISTCVPSTSNAAETVVYVVCRKAVSQTVDGLNGKPGILGYQFCRHVVGFHSPCIVSLGILSALGVTLCHALGMTL